MLPHALLALGLHSVGGVGEAGRAGEPSWCSRTQASDDAKLLERARALVAKLGDEDFETRQAAEKELLTLPVRLSPAIEALGKESQDLEIRTRASRVVVEPSWARLLGGTLGEARAQVEALARPDRAAAIDRMVAALAGVDPALEGLLASPEPGVREFALAALARFPAKDASKLLPSLEDPALGPRAARALVAAGDRSVVGKAVELFAKGNVSAAAVLEHFGPGDEAPRVAAAVRSQPGLADIGIRILARADAEKSLIELLEAMPERGAEIVAALERSGGEACLPTVRAWFKGRPDAYRRDRALFTLRDPAWAAEKLAELRKSEGELFSLSFDQVAAAGGPALREAVLDWLRAPGVKVGTQKQLLPLLGAAGRAEDGGLIVEKLKDRRLREEAGEALDRLGDPAHARAVLGAFLKSDVGVRLRRASAALPADGLEDLLLESLSDPGNAIRSGNVVLRLVERRPTPPLREALFRGVLEFDIGWTSQRAEALRILAATAKPEDAPWVEKLRGHSGRDSTIKVCGLLVAVRSGDAKAAPELAAILSGAERFFLPHREARDWGASSHLLEWAAPVGPAWTRAVAEAWKVRTDWTDGAIWLARREHREALDHLRARRGTFDVKLLPRVEATLAACGDPDALDRLVARGQEKNYLSPEDEQAFVAAAGRERRAAVVALARAKPGFSDAGLPRLAALLAHPDGLSLYRAVIARDSGDSSSTDLLTPRCARALGTLGAKDAGGDLRRLLRSQSAVHRAAAAEALGALGDRAAIPALVRLVDDPFEVQEEGGRMSTDYLDLPMRRVWHAAMEALEKIAGVTTEGRTVSDRREFWRAWHARNR